MSTAVRPIGNRVLIKADSVADKTESGIFIPELSKEQPTKGKIIAVGDNDGESMPVSVGDIVIFGKYSGVDITIDKDEFMIMKVDDIMAIVEYTA